MTSTPTTPAPSSPTEKEAALIQRRRAAWGARQPEAEAPVTGLALSGGGIRSATFSLGLLQALAEHKRLPYVDYLSTVSGGGYAGSFLGSLFLPRYDDLTVPYPTQEAGDTRTRETPQQAGERVEKILTDPPHTLGSTVTVDQEAVTTFHPLRWLRENGRYLTPTGAGDYMLMAAYYLRSLIGVQTVLGVVLFGVALACYSARLMLDSWVPLSQFWALSWAPALREGAVLWTSPILWLAPLVLVLFSLPLVLTYWIVYQQFSRHRSVEDSAVALGPALIAAASGALAIYAAEKAPGNPITWVLMYVSAAHLIALLIRNGWFTLQLGPRWTTQASQVALARQKLTDWLTISLYAALALAGIGVIDSLGQSMFMGLVRSELTGWGSSGAGVAVAVLLLRRAAGWISVLAKDTHSNARVKNWVTRNYKLAATLVALLAIVTLAAVHAAVVQTVCWSSLWPEWRHLEPSQWDSVSPTRATASLHEDLLMWTWLVWGMVALLVGLSVGFLNNSTFHRFYASRLTRTYLGAANLVRLKQFWGKLQAAKNTNLQPHPQPDSPPDSPPHSHPHTDDTKPHGTLLIESHHDDDLALRSYYELESAGPLHLINATLNESVSKTSTLQRQDRKGVAFCMGPAGIGVNGNFRPWRSGVNQTGSTLDLPGPHADDLRLYSVERLPLGAWMAISGAAVSTGLGRLSAAGISLLTWLANARLAYWWQPAPLMRTVPAAQAIRDLHPARIPNAYALMWQEMRGAFLGQCCRYWNLSDGGHFENTGAYELIRRRVPLIFVADNGADPSYGFNDVQNLVRRVRIDMGAEVCFLDRAALDALAGQARSEHAPLRALLGAPTDFQTTPRPPHACALVARVHYAADAQGQRAQSLMVFIKPTLTPQAPLDVHAYGAEHTDFPQQTTADQFFEEAQWESYRKLGLELGRALFAHWGAFVETT